MSGTTASAPAPEGAAPVVHDLVGVGLGPFGLGMAALSAPLEDVDAVFLEQSAEFRWHPGMLLEGATIQVPFLADLVTMADPTSPYSFLAFLKETGRLYPFYIRESFYPLRTEYEAYCRWVATQLPDLLWGRRVTQVRDAGEHWEVTAELLGADEEVLGTETHRGRHLVLAVGTRPVLPPALAALQGRTDAPVIHTAQYLEHRERLLDSGAITIVGSGQSAAEIYRDLLQDAVDREVQLDWITRSPRFFPMEYTKLTLEMTSPEYTDHYRSLPPQLREELGRSQRGLYKGISADLIDDIHDQLYRLSQAGRQLPTRLLTDIAVTGARAVPDAPRGRELELSLEHGQLGTTARHRTGAVVAATGYRSALPEFLQGVRDLLEIDGHGRLDVRRDYTVDRDRRIHVLNAEEHTHGVTAPDLGFGPWRASVVLDAITGREPYPIERRIAFQTFGLPADLDVPPSSAPSGGTGPADTADAHRPDPAATAARPTAATWQEVPTP